MNKFAVPVYILYNICMLIKKNKEMKKEYLLIGVGGMNGEIWSFEGRFDNLNEVFEYCSREEICDINGYRFRNVYDEDYWEREDFMCDFYNDEVEGDVIGVYGINEGCELVEVMV